MRLETVIRGSRVLHGTIVSRQMLRLGQGLVGSRSVFRLINRQTVGCLALAALFAGCGAEQSPDPSPSPPRPSRRISKPGKILGIAYMQQGRLDVAEKELSEALKMAMGGMAYEKQQLAAAKVALSTAKTPAEKNAAQDEISAAKQAGKLAAGKYQRGMSFLQNVRAKRSTSPVP